jgi:hypothetical protein
MTVIVLPPTVSAMAPHDVAVVHVTPLIVSVPDENVGVNVVVTTRYATDDVYDDVDDVNDGDSVSDDVVDGDDVVPTTAIALTVGDARAILYTYVPSVDDVTANVFEPTTSAHTAVMVPLVTATPVAPLHWYVTAPDVNTIVACND